MSDSEMRKLVQAFLDGKPLQLQVDGCWYDTGTMSMPALVERLACGREFRVKPLTRWRPWKLAEAPDSGWFRVRRSAETEYCMLYKHDRGIGLSGHTGADTSYVTLLDEYEIRHCGRIDWQPCGVKEG